MTSSMTGATGRIGAPNPNASTGLKSAPGYRTYQTMTPEAMNLYQQMFGMVGPESYLSRLAGGDQEMFGQIEAPALKQFSGLQGNIASRFSGMGMGGRRSSGFQNTMNQAGQDFASQLQSQRQGLQQNALMELAQISQMLMGQSPYAMINKRQKQPSGWGGLVGAGIGGLGGFAMGGPSMGLQGAQLGYGIGSSF